MRKILIASVLFVFSYTTVQAADVNLIQSQVRQAAEQRQEQASDSPAQKQFAPKVDRSPLPSGQAPKSNADQPDIEILWQAFGGKIRLWKLEGQLFLSIRLQERNYGAF